MAQQLRETSNVVFSDRGDFLMVAAVDFGTTFSGYAFSFKSNPDDIKMNKNWGANLGFQSYKTPTSVLVGPYGQCEGFGYEAESKYSDIVEGQGDATQWDMFRHFKMALHSKKVTRKTPLSSTNGTIKPAMDIFAMALKYLKDHLIEAVSRQLTSPPDESMIRWVITVPAIWKEESKQFMREAAFKAGYIKSLDSRQLAIALEPEAASLCCRRLEVSHFQGSHQGAVQFQSGAKYLVIDSGGGTVDVTAHQILSHGSVKELHAATGGAWGGTRVDENFVKLLSKVLGTHFVNTYKSQCPQQWLVLMTNFERVKRAVKPDGSSSMNLSLSWSLGSEYTKIMNKTVEQAVRDASHYGVTFTNGSLSINHKAVQEMFEPVLDNIVSHIRDLTNIPQIQPCKYFFLVGGFSESEFLQKAIRDNFGQQVDVLIPNEAQMSVIKGAVLFGHCPAEIKSRIARKSYGYRHLAEFDSNKHKSSKKVVKEGKELCEDLFGNFVQKGDEVDIGDKKTSNHNPVTATQDAMDIEFYCLDARSNPVHYINDPGMERLGYLHLEMPNTAGGLSRTVRLDITFGGTEIQAYAEDVSSGNKAETTLNFLAG